MRAAKAHAYDAMRADYASLKQSWGGNSDYDAWFAQPLNNATIAAVATYRRWVPALRARIDALGLAGVLRGDGGPREARRRAARGAPRELAQRGVNGAARRAAAGLAALPAARAEVRRRDRRQRLRARCPSVAKPSALQTLATPSDAKLSSENGLPGSRYSPTHACSAPERRRQRHDRAAQPELRAHEAHELLERVDVRAAELVGLAVRRRDPRARRRTRRPRRRRTRARTAPARTRAAAPAASGAAPRSDSMKESSAPKITDGRNIVNATASPLSAAITRSARPFDSQVVARRRARRPPSASSFAAAGATPLRRHARTSLPASSVCACSKPAPSMARLVEDPDEVHRGVATREQVAEPRFVVDVGFDELDCGRHEQRAAARPAARRNSHDVAGSSRAAHASRRPTNPEPPSTSTRRGRCLDCYRARSSRRIGGACAALAHQDQLIAVAALHFEDDRAGVVDDLRPLPRGCGRGRG